MSIPQESLKRAVTVYVEAGETVGVEKAKPNKRPNYFMIGNGTMNRHQIYGIDLLTELANTSKAGQYLLLAIKDGITWDNDYHYEVKVVGETSTEKQYIKAGYKELYDRGLVVRTKRAHYMINPNALIPPDYDSALAKWNELELD